MRVTVSTLILRPQLVWGEWIHPVEISSLKLTHVGSGFTYFAWGRLFCNRDILRNSFIYRSEVPILHTKVPN